MVPKNASCKRASKTVHATHHLSWRAHRSHVGTSSESESGLGFDDIGKLLESGPLNLSASEKMKLVEEHFVPSESFAFPKVQMNLHNQ